MNLLHVLMALNDGVQPLLIGCPLDDPITNRLNSLNNINTCLTNVEDVTRTLNTTL